MPVAKKQKLIFKKGVHTIHIPVTPPLGVDGNVCIDAPRIINKALKGFIPRKNIGIDLVYSIGTSGTSMEVVLCKYKK